MPIAAALSAADAAFTATVERLIRLVRIPSCSFPGFDPAHVQSSADDTAAWLGEAGFPEVRVIRFPADNPLPYVLARDHRAGPDAPTVLLYAHHDVQPPLRQEVWKTPPYEPTRIGDRLYARGAADDKAGIAVHCAAAAAWTATRGRPPVNLTVLIEGEEEIGSPHMAEFLAAHAAELACDTTVIADLGNVDTGLPSLTTSLRGLVKVEIELRALRAPLHSGMWGGAVPDVGQALCKLLASLTDADNRLAIPGMFDQVRRPEPETLRAWSAIPHDPARLADQAGVLSGRMEADPSTLYRRVWREPSLSINAIQCGLRGQTGNVLMDCAWATLGIRIVPDQDPPTVMRLLCDHVRRHTPAGMDLTITERSCSPAWGCATDDPVFALAKQALRTGYGADAVEMGCGASIPFVGDLCAILDVPALLIGVEDPSCGAHAENESVHLGDLRKAIRSEVALFGLMAGLTSPAC